MNEPQWTRSVVVLDPSDVAAARALAAAHRVEVEEVPRRGIEPVATVTLVLAGAVTAVATVLRILDERKGGQVIDLRPGTPKAFYRTPDVVYGTVVIVAVDGKVTVVVKQSAGRFSKVTTTLPGLLSGGGGNAQQVAQTVTGAFGPDVEVDTVAIPAPGDGE